MYYYISDCLYNVNGQLRFEDLSIYCDLHDYGFIERTIRKSGCNINLTIHKEDMELMQLLDNLLYCDLSSHIKIDFRIKEYDYIILDARKDNNWRGLDEFERAKEKLVIVNTYSNQEKKLKENYKTEYFFRGIAEGLDTCVIKVK